jgi:hypothetical protein
MSNMPGIGSSLRGAFDVVEGPLTRASEASLQSDALLDALAVAWKLRRRAACRLEAASEPWLRVWGFATRSDVTALANQVAALERELRSRR